MEDVNAVIDKMKESGIDGALIRKDGVKVYSTLAFEENAPDIIASFSNTLDALMKKVKEKNNEIEISAERGYFIIIPVGDFYLCGLADEREKKKILRECAKTISGML